MPEPIISVENLGKSYLIGHDGPKERYTTLRDSLARHGRHLWDRTRRALRGQSHVSGAEIEEFWALKDVSFEVQRGEVVGIIGRNGAGKSTLLKILSRITEPTTGRVTLRGRVASLLEVGTGFHPELTGRENIFLNGAILGMSGAEIKRKFDEIVAFAEVEKFLDTPVKRYSSGMYVRLAFAVAAHLEPEILIVDEVLAVGDAAFQNKCLGKMQDVAAGGRTVLFVSHNMAAAQSLCARGIVLEVGRLLVDGPVATAINRYVQGAALGPPVTRSTRLGACLSLARFECNPSIVERHSAVDLYVSLESTTDEVISDLAFLIQAPNGERAALIDLRPINGPLRLSPGSQLQVRATIPDAPFVEGDFALGLYINATSVCASFPALAVLNVFPPPADGVVPREAQFRGVVELRPAVEHHIVHSEDSGPADQRVGSCALNSDSQF